MDPAIVLCASVAAVTLAAGLVGAAAPAMRRAAEVRIPMPLRSIAAAVTMVSLFAFVSRPRPAGASVEPPIVRLGEAPTVATGDDDAQIDTAVVRTPSRAAARERRSAGASSTYVVEPGDCLWHIARATLAERTGDPPTSEEIARFWPAIYDANRAVIGDDPNLIFPGQQLEIPEG